MGAGAQLVRSQTAIILVPPADVVARLAPTAAELVGVNAVPLHGTDDLGEAATSMSGGDKSARSATVSRIRTLTDEKIPTGSDISDIVVDVVTSKDDSENAILADLSEGDTFELYQLQTATPDTPAEDDFGWIWRVSVSAIGPNALDISGAHSYRIVFAPGSVERATVAGA